MANIQTKKEAIETAIALGIKKTRAELDKMKKEEIIKLINEANDKVQKSEAKLEPVVLTRQLSTDVYAIANKINEVIAYLNKK